jgi:hypothetical protein
MATVTMSATATSTKSGLLPVESISYTANNQSVANPVKLSVGNHTICAVVSDGNNGQVKDCSNVTVAPSMISGKVISPTVTGEYVPQNTYIVFGPEGGAQDSTKIGADGSYTLNTRYVGMGNVPVIVRGDLNVIPSLIRTSVEFFLNPTIIMVPRGFASPSCPTSGPSKVFPIDLEGAYALGGQNLSFFMRSRFDPANGDGTVKFPFFTYNVGSWKTLPIKVAVTAGDSTSFWIHADSLNRALCMTTFVQAKQSEVSADVGITTVVDNTRVADMAYVSFWPAGDYKSGGVFFSQTATMRDREGVQHELIHTLGIGHSACARIPSVMQWSCDGWIGNLPPIQREYDVVYITLMRRVRDLERKYNTRFSLAYAHQGEKVLLKNLPEDAVAYMNENGTFPIASIGNPAGPMVPIIP